MGPRAQQYWTSCATVAWLLAVHANAFGAQQSNPCDAMKDGAALVQTIQDAETHTPVVGAVVIAAWQQNGEQAVRVVTDPAGRALICAPADRTITLRATFMNIKLPVQLARLTLTRPTLQTINADLPGAYVQGSVLERETGMPVANVGVRIRNTPLSTVTDTAGRFFFEHVPLGDYSLRVEHLAYAPVATPLNVRSEDLNVSIRLVPAAIALAPVVVTTFSRRLEHTGFYERQKRGVGTFLGRAQIEAMHAQSASDLLARVPSIRLTPQIARGRPAMPRNTTAGRGNCRYKFIVDGSRTLPDFEMDFVNVGAIEGLEVYNGLSEVPAAFRGVATMESAPSCGVIAVWTRDGR